ncbi:MAG: acyl-ACP--UDP-N-acetylglucosamine O-acyltransferase [Cyclobacteriaceae bacterium]|nr:acyl-ACP--UDP-N-acetylglucosamine O-acyltransferase [Cyclobacteriaceae bacterium HetDA_MAG_MS6]
MISPLAHIHPDAQIADDVVVEPFTTIAADVVIEQGCWVGPNANILDGARIGKNCRIYAGAQIACLPQDLKFDGEKTIAKIGENTEIREFVTISRGTSQRQKTTIGGNCLIMAYAHVAHDCDIEDHCILGNAVQVAGHVHIGEYAIISGTSAVHQFVKVGPHVMISGGSLVRKDVPPYIKAARDPLSFTGINSVGLKRRGFSAEQIHDIQEAFRILYQSGINNTLAIDTMIAEIAPSVERDAIIRFVKESERGIIRGPE